MDRINTIYSDCAKDIEEYLIAKLPDISPATAKEIGAYISYKCSILVSDLFVEQVRQINWRKDAELDGPEVMLMKHALVIKTDMILRPEMMAMYQKEFAEQLKTGVVLIPAFFNAELINVPTDVDVFIESEDPESGRKYF